MNVDIYRNLRSKRLSLRAREGAYRGLVIAHSDRVLLADVEFIVSEAGRHRALKTLQRNVHAYARGHLVGLTGFYKRIDVQYPIELADADYQAAVGEDPIAIGYNPFRIGIFIDKTTHRPVFSARYAEIRSDGTILCPVQ